MLTGEQDVLAGATLTKTKERSAMSSDLTDENDARGYGEERRITYA